MSTPAAARVDTDRGSAWRVPGRVEADGEVVTVTRAWPGKERRGSPTVTVEGRDRAGRLRAGTVRRDGGVDLLAPGADPALPALEPLAAAEPTVDVELLVHRAGRRAVLRHAGGYTKAVRAGRSAAVVEAATTGGALAAAAGLVAPQVLDHDVDRAAVTMSVLPGRPVAELSDDAAWAQAWQAWADAWARLQGQTHERLTPHTPDDEAEVVGQWAAKARRAGVVPGVWAERADEVGRRLRGTGAPGRFVPAHRDLHDKQLLWDGAALGVLDLDTACLADPALDPANLAVHADLRRAQGLWSDGTAQVVQDVARSVAGSAGVDDGRWRTAELATVVRLACVYAFRPPWRDLVLAWADQRWGHLTTDDAVRTHLR